MAIIRKNPLLDGISGKIGNLVFKGGETYIASRPHWTEEFKISDKKGTEHSVQICGIICKGGNGR